MSYGIFSYGIEDYASTPAWPAATTSGLPWVFVEIAWTTPPGSTTPAWVDVSDRLISATINRGRQRELDNFQAGRAQIILTNEDRALDPTFTSSPFYPNVVPMRRIRIRAVWNGVTYTVFSGYVDGYTQEYDPPDVARCVIEATDAFKVLANITLPQSVFYAEMAADSPLRWFRLDEPSSATAVLDAVTGQQAAVVGSPSLGSTALVAHDSGAAMTITGSGDNTGVATSLTAPVLISGYPMTLSAIINPSANSVGSVVNLVDVNGRSIAALYYWGNGGGNQGVSMQVWLSNGTSLQVYGTVAINPGETHLISGTWDLNGNVQVYIDGVATGASGSLTGAVSPAVAVVIGGVWYATWRIVSMIGTIDEVAVFNKAVAPSRMAAWAAARWTPWQGDGSGVRVGRLLDAAGWPAADRQIDTGMAVLQSADLGSAALSQLQSVELTEQGALFVTADGKVRFIARDSLLRSPYNTSQATFGDTGTDLEYGDLTYEYDDQLIYNEARVSRANGTVQVASDANSQATYLRRTRSLSGLLQQSDSTSVDLANWIVTHYKDPILRVTDMKLQPSAGNQLTHFPQVLGRELMDRVTVKRTPQNVGPTIQQDALIEGIQHRIAAMQWETEWNLSPAETQAYWLAGVAGNSEAGQTTRAGF